MRTEEGELDFAKACMVIEKRGGDVLAYIAKEYPSYTPRPVWYRLQRDYLKRKPFQITEGRPRKKGTDEMRKERGSMEQSAAALVECVKSGKDPKECLIDLGYTNANTALRNLRNWTKENRPEWYETIADVRLGGKIGRPRKTEKPAEKPEERKPITTCCAPSPRKGVEVPDVLPEDKITEHMPEGDVTKDPELAVYPIGGKPMTFSITGVRSALGKWQIDADGDYVFIADNESGSCIMSLSMKEWLNLSAEIPVVIRAMNGMK